jgi:hypothetical protein
MFAPFLLTVVLSSAGADDQSDLATLIGHLAAPAFDDRVVAYKALERKGGDALPALRAAANSSNSRVRSRVRALINSIGRQVERDRFARPMLIQLEFRDQPLSDVVDALNQRYDLGLSLRVGAEPRRGTMVAHPVDPKPLKELRDSRITLESAQPLPFWETIDQLCKMGALHYDMSAGVGFGTSRSFLVLMAGRTGRGPISDSGPFRIQITAVQSDFENDFTLDPDQARRRPKPPGTGDLTVPLAVLPEPGLVLHQNGPVIVTEAIDDRGRSLVSTVRAEVDPNQANRAPYLMNGHASIHVRAVLVAPDPPATVIRRLSGKVPVIAVARGLDPMIIPLKAEHALGKPYSTRDMTLVVNEAVFAPGARPSVKVTIRPNRGDLAPTVRSDPRRPDFTAFNRDQLLEHLQLHDAVGRRLNHTLGEQTRGADGQGFYDRYQLIVAPDLQDGLVNRPGASKVLIPSELRYYAFVQTVTEVPFDFRNIPMP